MWSLRQESPCRASIFRPVSPTRVVRLGAGCFVLTPITRLFSERLAVVLVSCRFADLGSVMSCGGSRRSLCPRRVLQRLFGTVFAATVAVDVPLWGCIENQLSGFRHQLVMCSSVYFLI